MAIIDGKETFDQLEDKLGNRYDAVMTIAHEARKRAEAVDNKISHSEALSWVMTGNKPESLLESERQCKLHNSKQRLDRIVDEELMYVTDSLVAECVRKSVDQSYKERNLVYFYSKHLSDAKRARVRVLTNLIWHKFKDD